MKLPKIDRWDGKGFSSVILDKTDADRVLDILVASGAPRLRFSCAGTGVPGRGDENRMQISAWGPKAACETALRVALAAVVIDRNDETLATVIDGPCTFGITHCWTITGLCTTCGAQR